MKQFLIIIFLALNSLVPGYAGDIDKVYTVGVVPQFESRRIHAIWQPILTRLQEKTGFQFKLQSSADIVSFEREFIEGRFDFAYMNPYHMLIAHEQAGYIPLARDHGRMLYGVLVVNRDSGITDPSQLNGKTLAFPSPNALGASLQMHQELHDIFGIKFKSKYVKTHDSVYLNVLLNEASAGGGVQKTFNRQKNTYKEKLRIIHKTKKVEPHPFAVLPIIPITIRNRVLEALLEMGKSKEGQTLLTKVPMKKIGPAIMADYLPLQFNGTRTLLRRTQKIDEH